MTPLDVSALQAMLLSFYPTPSAAALEQARRERPEYFAGGVLVGRDGAQLQLGDGRVITLLGAADGSSGAPTWQALDTTTTPGSWSDDELRARIAAALAAVESIDDPAYWFAVIRRDSRGADWAFWQYRISIGDGAHGGRGGGGGGGTGDGGDPFVLTPGPLVPLDDTAPIFPAGGQSFEALVTDHLAGLDGADARLSLAGQTAIEFTGAAALEDSSARDLEPAIEAHAEIRAALDGDDPIDLLEATSLHDSEIDRAREDYVEPPPPDTPEPEPGTPPGGDGTEPTPGPPQA